MSELNQDCEAEGRGRGRCKPCEITTLNEIDSTAKHRNEFVAWLLGRRRQEDLPGGGVRFAGVVAVMALRPITCWAGTRPGEKIPEPGAPSCAGSRPQL